MTVQCPHCGQVLEATPQQRYFACPHCGLPLEAPVAAPGDTIIDVNAEVLSDEEFPVTEPFSPVQERPQGPEYIPLDPEIRTITWHAETRTPAGPGCCSLGCLVMALLIGLMVHGLISLF